MNITIHTIVNRNANILISISSILYHLVIHFLHYNLSVPYKLRKRGPRVIIINEDIVWVNPYITISMSLIVYDNEYNMIAF